MYYGLVALAPDGSKMVVRVHTEECTVWSTSPPSRVAALEKSSQGRLQGVTSGDTLRFAATLVDPPVDWDTPYKRQVQEPTHRQCTVWDTSSGRVVDSFELWGTVHAMSHDGGVVVCKSKPFSNAVYIYSRRTKTRVSLPDSRWVQGCAVSRDNRMVCTTHSTCWMLWDAASGQRIYHVMTDTKFDVRCAFSPDGTRVAIASKGICYTWHTANLRPELRIRTSTRSAPVALAFSSDGSRLAVLNHDGVTVLFCASTGARRQQTRMAFPAYGADASDIRYLAAFSADASTLTVAGHGYLCVQQVRADAVLLFEAVRARRRKAHFPPPEVVAAILKLHHS